MTFEVSSIPRGRQLREAFPLIGVCAQDYTWQSTVDFEPIPGMAVLLEPHCAYAITAYLSYSSDTAADLWVRLDRPTLSAGQWGINGLPSAATGSVGSGTADTAQWLQEGTFSGVPDSYRLAGIGTSTPAVARLSGFCATASYGGALQLVGAQYVSTASVTTLHALSWLEVVKIDERS